MSSTSETIIKKKPSVWIIRLLMFSRIFFIVAALVFAVILWHQNTNKLLNSINILASVNPNIELLEQGIKNLYDAENDFRYYIATYENKYFQDYTTKIKTVANIFDTLQTALYQKRPTGPSSFDSIFYRKLIAGNVFINMKRSIDSLLMISMKWDTVRPRLIVTPTYDASKIRAWRSFMESSDTIKLDAKPEKERALISINWERLRKKKAKKDEAGEQVVTHSKSATVDSALISGANTDSMDALFAKDIQNFYMDHINKYINGQSRLNKQETEIVKLNSLLIKELEEILKSIKENEIASTNFLKADSSFTAKQSARIISSLAVIAFIFASVLFFLIVVNLRKVELYTNKLDSEREKAETLLNQKNNLLTNLNSQIRTQLAQIIGFTEQINHSDITKEQEKYTKSISQASDKLLFMSNQIMDYMGLDAQTLYFEKNIFNPYKSIQQLSASFLPFAKAKKLNLSAHLADDNLLVEGDEKRFKQIVGNLISNSIKFTKTGEVNIRTFVTPMAENKIMITIEVEDTGIGIKESLHEAIFSPFFQAGRAENGNLQEGSGLGLTICKMLTTQLHGTIHLKSKPNSGTLVTVAIPFTTKQVSTTDSNSRPTDKDLSKRTPSEEVVYKKVLLIDDDEQSALLFKSVLKKHAYLADISSNTTNGLILFENKIYSAVILSTSLPIHSIVETIKTIRKNRISVKSKIPIVLLTNNIHEQNQKPWKDLDFTHSLLKPVKENEPIKLTPKFSQKEKNTGDKQS